MFSFNLALFHGVIGEGGRKPLPFPFCNDVDDNDDDVSLFLHTSVLFILGSVGGGGGELNKTSVPDDVLRSPIAPVSELPSENELTTCSFEGGAEGTKNLAPAAGLTAGAEGKWNEFANESLPLLKVSTYLGRSESL